jgi:hypothetical protein
MKRLSKPVVILVLLAAMAILPIAARKRVRATAAIPSVTTYHNDNSRTGLNSQETILTPANITSRQFGRLFTQGVDQNIFAQPLYVPNVAISGKGTHNVVFVCTENDTVYAFDADRQMPALWQANMIDAAHGGVTGEIPMGAEDIGSPIPLTFPNQFTPQDLACAYFTLHNIGTEIGITSTPVIDLSTNKMYVETKSKRPGAIFVHRLHALDITTGNDIARVNITAQNFDPLHQLQRPALLLSNGTVFVAFGSHADWSGYNGWLFAYNAATLAQTGVLCTTPGGSEGAIWMSGNGPAADQNGNLFLTTANGTFDTTLNSQGYPQWGDFGDSVLKISPGSGSLFPVDYFTTNNQATLNGSDLDVGAGGVLLLPDQPGNNPHLLVQAGKDGTIYLINRDQMTTLNRHYCPSCTPLDSQIVQEFYMALGNNINTPCPPIPPGCVCNNPPFQSQCNCTNDIDRSGGQQDYYGSPVYWNNNVYFWGINDALKQYTLTNGLLGATPHAATDIYTPTPYVSPANCGGWRTDPVGGHMSISSNGNQSGIVWSLSSQLWELQGSLILRAHDANTLAELYSSDWMSSDDAGPAVKFATPTVVNGKVYVGAGGQLTVYGRF